MIDERIIGQRPKSVEIFLKIKRIFNILITLIFVPILIISLLMLLQTVIDKNNVPNIWGYKFFVITSGSMEPNINVGNFIVVKETQANKLQNNDIISFKQENSIITHRIIEISQQNDKYQFTTKGDNNNVKDDGFVAEDSLEGKFLFSIPILGEIVLFVQKPTGLIILISIPILLTLINYKINDIINEREIQRKNKRIAYTKNIEKNTKGEDR